jgi:hypothetical protein
VKKGDARLSLPAIDVPVNVVEWEIYMPDQVRIDRSDGNVIAASLFPVPSTGLANGAGSGSGIGSGVGPGMGGGLGGGLYRPGLAPVAPAASNEIVGRVVDPTGAAVPGVTVTMENGGRRQQVFTATDGSYVVSNLGPGAITITGELQGFQTARRTVAQAGQEVDLTLDLAAVNEAVTVTSAAPAVEKNARALKDDSKSQLKQVETPSANLQNLQRRASGVLPVRIDVPRAGTSHRFVRPLVIDEETTVTFHYRRR